MDSGKAKPFKTANDYVPQAGLPHNKKHSKNYTPDAKPPKKLHDDEEYNSETTEF